MDEQAFVLTAGQPPGVGVPAAELARLTSAILADSLDEVGRRDQVLRPGLGPVWPGAQALGRARTVRFAPVGAAPVGAVPVGATPVDSAPVEAAPVEAVPVEIGAVETVPVDAVANAVDIDPPGVDRSGVDPSGADPYGPIMGFVDGLEPGDLAVVATGPDDRTGYWGELFSAAAIGRGAVGTICDGPVRDVAKVAALGYPVFAAGTRPVDFAGRMRVVETGGPVELAGVVIAPGDLVLADRDGVVVVPRDVIDPVLERALRRAGAEREVLRALLDGASLRQVWQRWGVL
jgi:regulator of RNase E activity RraA